MEYVLFREIQETLKSKYKATEQPSDFVSALCDLQENGQTHIGTPSNPDFLSWNLTDFRYFRNLIGQIPVSVSRGISYAEKYKDEYEAVALPNSQECQICIESNFASRYLTRLDRFVVLYTLYGTAGLNLSTEKYTMHQGEVCIIPPDTPFSVFTTSEDLVVNAMTNRELFEKNFSSLLHKSNPLAAFFRNTLFQGSKEIFFFMVPPEKNVCSIIQHLFYEFVNQDTYSLDMYNNYLQTFFVHMIRSHESTYAYYTHGAPFQSASLIPSILEYINQNYTCITLESLAKRFYYTPSYMSSLIRHYTGKNFVQIITDLKIDKAKNLLLTTDLRIEEISEISGV
ncbi:MAG: hypothetical protein LUD14_00600 [Clostridiales bacterium]|nr:hypothetical protein [Clostridiales bacterium]